MGAPRLGLLSLLSSCLDANTITHVSGAWSRIFHLMQVCCLPLCTGRPVLCVMRAWLLCVCVSLALLCALPPGLTVSLWPGAVGLCSALEKVLYFRLVFRLCISVLFPGFVFALKFPARFSGFQRLDFFLRIFSRRFFRRKFPGYFFRVLFSGIFPGLIFAAVSGFLFFLNVIFIRFPVLRDEFFHVVKFQELVHGGLVNSVALAF